jgi:translation initiation factor 5B
MQPNLKCRVFVRRYGAILAFDVKIERDAQELADNLGVKIFQADIIYHLFDKFTAHREQLKQQLRQQYKHIAVFPCKLRIMPQVSEHACNVN